MTAEALDANLALIWLELIFNYGDSLPSQKLILKHLISRIRGLIPLCLMILDQLKILKTFTWILN